MKCETIRDGLSAYLDGELGTHRREEMREHLATCADCAAAYEVLREVSDRSRAFFYEAVDSLGDLRETEERVVASTTLAFEKELERAPRRKWSRLLIVSLGVAGLFAWWWWTRPDDADRALEDLLDRVAAHALVHVTSEGEGAPAGKAEFALLTDGRGHFRARPWLPLGAWPRPTRAGRERAWFGAVDRFLWTYDPAARVVRREPAPVDRPLLERARSEPAVWTKPGYRSGALLSALRALDILRGPGKDASAWRRAPDAGSAVSFELRTVEPPGDEPVTLRLAMLPQGGVARLEFGAWRFRLEFPETPPSEACGWRGVIADGVRIQ